MLQNHSGVAASYLALCATKVINSTHICFAFLAKIQTESFALTSISGFPVQNAAWLVRVTAGPNPYPYLIISRLSVQMPPVSNSIADQVASLRLHWDQNIWSGTPQQSYIEGGSSFYCTDQKKKTACPAVSNYKEIRIDRFIMKGESISTSAVLQHCINSLHSHLSSPVTLHLNPLSIIRFSQKVERGADAPHVHKRG